MKKGRKDVYNLPFVPLGKDMLFKCQEWKELSSAARDIYIMLKAKYNRKNNGNLQLYYRELQRMKGLRNAQTISKAFKELEDAKWIERTRTGGLFRKPNQYRLSGEYDNHL